MPSSASWSLLSHSSWKTHENNCIGWCCYRCRPVAMLCHPSGDLFIPSPYKVFRWQHYNPPTAPPPPHTPAFKADPAACVCVCEVLRGRQEAAGAAAGAVEQWQLAGGGLAWKVNAFIVGKKEKSLRSGRISFSTSFGSVVVGGEGEGVERWSLDVGRCRWVVHFDLGIKSFRMGNFFAACVCVSVSAGHPKDTVVQKWLGRRCSSQVQEMRVEINFGKYIKLYLAVPSCFIRLNILRHVSQLVPQVLASSGYSVYYFTLNRPG